MHGARRRETHSETEPGDRVWTSSTSLLYNVSGKSLHHFLSFTFLIIKIKLLSREKGGTVGGKTHKHGICQQDDWEMSDKEESSIRGR